MNIWVFVALYVIVSLISTFHVVEFFKLSNPTWLAVSLAIAFEVGAAACLSAITILEKTSRWMVMVLFMLITGMQVCGNVYYSYVNLTDYAAWSELFGLSEQEPLLQKRVISWISGGVLPVVALLFVKCLVDYVKPPTESTHVEISQPSQPSQPEEGGPEQHEELLVDVAGTPVSVPQPPSVDANRYSEPMRYGGL